MQYLRLPIINIGNLHELCSNEITMDPFVLHSIHPYTLYVQTCCKNEINIHFRCIKVHLDTGGLTL